MKVGDFVIHIPTNEVCQVLEIFGRNQWYIGVGSVKRYLEIVQGLSSSTLYMWETWKITDSSSNFSFLQSNNEVGSIPESIAKLAMGDKQNEGS